jgi:hypothetical protein
MPDDTKDLAAAAIPGGKGLLEGQGDQAQAADTKHPADKGEGGAAAAAGKKDQPSPWLLKIAPAKAGEAVAKPESLPDAAWDATTGSLKTDELLKAYKGARDALAKGAHKPPEKPEGYALPKVDGFELAADDKLVPVVREAAHKAGVSQLQFEGMVAPVMAWLQGEADRLAKDPPEKTSVTLDELKANAEGKFADEVKKLGPQSEAIRKNLGTWLNGQVAKGVLGPDDAKALGADLRTAGSIRALTAIMRSGVASTMPIDPSLAQVATGSLEDYYKLTAQAFAEKDSAKKSALQRQAAELLKALDEAGAVPATPVAGMGASARA